MERWEAELGMPVHRMATGKGETVYSFVRELERWRASLDTIATARESTAASGEESLPSAGSDVPGKTAGPAARTDVANPAGRPERPVSAGARTGFAPADRNRMVWAIAGLVLTAVVVSTVWAVRSAEPADAKLQPADYQVRGNVLTVYGPDGATLWTHFFEFPLDRSLYDFYRKLGKPVVLFEDINRDGNKEVLFVSNPADETSQGLYCFSWDGKRVLFEQRVSRTVQFGDRAYADPWRAAWIYLSDRGGGGKWVWLVSLHYPFSPSVLQKLGADGVVQGEYWSNGHITAVVPTVLNGKRVVLVGSTNEEQQGAALAVLDEADPDGSAPAEANSSRCERGCPPGHPLAFLVFRRLDIAAAIAGKAFVSHAVVNAAGTVLVTVLQSTGTYVPDADRDAASSYYELDAQFRVKRARLNERWPYIHRLFEGRDLVKPQAQSTADEGLWPVLRWDGAGLAQITAPERAQ